jgi:hypothetical protein
VEQTVSGATLSGISLPNVRTSLSDKVETDG